jgi:cell division protein FtsQ
MKKSGFFKRITVLLSVMLAGIASLFILWFIGKEYIQWMKNSDVFSIKNIHVVGNDLLSREEILSLGNIREKHSIWQVDLIEIQTRLENHAFLEKVQVERHYPNTIRISVQEKRPVALLNCEGIFYCIDTEAMVLPSKPGKLYNLPVISGDFKGGVSMGHKAGGKCVQQGLSFITILQNIRPELYGHISEVVVGKSEGLMVYTTKNAIPVWLGEDEYARKLIYLEAILGKLAREREIASVRYIDLRFEGQVVVGMRA